MNISRTYTATQGKIDKQIFKIHTPGARSAPGPAEGRAVWILLIFLLIFPCVAVYFLDIFLDIWLIYGLYMTVDV